MKFLSLFIIFGMTSSLFSSPEKTNAVSRQEIGQMTQSGPQMDSPFLIEREEAEQAAAQAATNSIYRNPVLTPPHSIQQQLKNLGRDLFGFMKVIPDKTVTPPLQLFLEPSGFSVAEVPELNVSFKITNDKKEMLFLEFPTNQRIDIVVKEADGTILTRWSQDRSFDPLPGVVTINPKESVLYTEKIPTTMMKDGTTYIIEVSLVGQQGYNCSQQITPR